MKKLLVYFLLLMLFPVYGYSVNELIGLIDKTTGEGIPDARTIFISSSDGVVSNLAIVGIFYIDGTNFETVVSDLIISLSDGRFIRFNQTNSVNTLMITNNAITSDKIANIQIINRHMAPNSVSGTNVIDYSITEDNLADEILGTSKFKSKTIKPSYLDSTNDYVNGMILAYDSDNRFKW